MGTSSLPSVFLSSFSYILFLLSPSFPFELRKPSSHTVFCRGLSGTHSIEAPSSSVRGPDVMRVWLVSLSALLLMSQFF